MGIEIEVKYLLRENGKSYATRFLASLFSSLESLEKRVREEGTEIMQGYIPLEIGQKIARSYGKKWDFEPLEARLRNEGGVYTMTMKGKGGTQRPELEFEITKPEFDDYWKQTENKRVHKIRLALPYNGHTAEIDVYTDRDLIVAEIEAPSLEIIKGLSPLGKDVSDNPAYKNKNLAK